MFLYGSEGRSKDNLVVKQIPPTQFIKFLFEFLYCIVKERYFQIVLQIALCDTLTKVMSEDWEIACSDDEKYEVKLVENGKWEPPPEVILKYYEELNSGIGYFELNWKCPGRRPPTPEKTEDQKEKENTTVETKSEEKDEYFDFEVDKGQLSLRPSGEVGPRGSAKKKTTSLDAILSNMARHRRMDMMEEDPPEITKI